jgi:hypothetical protein
MQAIAAIRAQQAALNQEIGVSLDKAAKLAASKISTALDISVKTGVAFGEILRTVGTAYTSEIVRFVNAIMNPVTGSTRSPTNDHGHAAGIVGDTSGTTRLTVGEAGTEHVAVLRSPRSLELKALSGIAPAAAGGTTVIVDVHDNKIEEGTMDSLVAKISAAVELSMNRKTSLLGFRTS